jgi:hypothetical protein
VSRIDEGLELDSDRIELVKQRRSIVPHFIALLWHCRRGSKQIGDAVDRLYKEAISTALAVPMLLASGEN